MKTWVINTMHVDDGQLVVGITTEAWIRASGDEGRPGDVTEQECLDQLRVLLAMVRPFDADEDPRKFLGRRLPQRGVG
jgi:hypothetical protein